jgi:hypothetical protein
MRRLGCSSHRLLAPVPLPVLSQPHSTAPPSPKRYDKRYEKEFLEKIRRTTNHADMVVARGMWSAGHKPLTNLSINGEHRSNTF